MKRIPCFLFCALVFFAFADVNATSTINSSNAYAWGANIGWTNCRPSAADGVVIGEFVCSGYIYGANVGWINVGSGTPANGIQYQNNSATDFGLNYSVSSQPGYVVLRGLAYGANIGWINFEATGDPRLHLTDGALEGYAYSANCGWINLGELARHDLFTDSVAKGIDTDGDGIADAFELLNKGNLTAMNGTTDSDGDGVSDLNEYLEGTNPTVPDDSLRITNYVRSPNGGNQNSQLTWKSTTARLYVIETNTNPDMSPLSWVDSGLGTLTPDAGTSTTRTATLPTVTKRFFRVRGYRPLP